MATDKRDRQRANRDEKKAAEAKVKRRQDALALIKKWAIYGILIASAFLALSLVFR